MQETELKVDIVPFGPDQDTIREASNAVMEHAVVREYLQDTRYNLLSFDLISPDQFRQAKFKGRPSPPRHYQATIFDYTNNRSIVVNGLLDNLEELQVSEFGTQPLPSEEEFEMAVRILEEQSEEISHALREGLVQPYPPMPPLVGEEMPDGHIERTIAAGLLPINDQFQHEIVGVNMIRQEVVRFENGAPPMAIADHSTCGHPYAGQQTVSSAAGQVWVTVTQGSNRLWRFLAVRPAASSGTNGSGVELRYVDYSNKRVLYRAHVPILNVRYHNDTCGPYLNWQNQEGMIDANGTDVAPGFRLCPTPAKTILDTGSDSGNYLGVAIYVKGLEVVLVSEMQAGW